MADQGKCKKATSKYKFNPARQDRRKAQKLMNHMSVFSGDKVAKKALDAIPAMHRKSVDVTGKVRVIDAHSRPEGFTLAAWSKLRKIFDRASATHIACAYAEKGVFTKKQMADYSMERLIAAA